MFWLSSFLFILVKSDGIATILNSTAISGQFLLSQETEGTVMLVDIKGLEPFSIHGLAIYEKSDNCYSAQTHFNPGFKSHGGLLDEERHAGDLGNIKADGSGSVLGKVLIEAKLSALEGLSIGITERQDDTGRSNSTQSKVDGNTGNVIGCGFVVLNGTIIESGSPPVANNMLFAMTALIASVLI